MPTDIISKIGVTNSPVVMDYTTLQAWEDASPANLVTDDKQWIGECYDQGEFVQATTLLTISGITTDATHAIILRCVSGASFKDKTSVRATPLDYNASNGVALRTTTTSNSAIVVSILNGMVGYVDGIQIRKGNTTYGTSILGGPHNTDFFFKNCIISGGTNSSQMVARFKNCLIRGCGIKRFTALGCTIIASPATHTALNPEYGIGLIKNSCVFGFTALKTSSLQAGSNYNATDLGTAWETGSNNLNNLTFANQFVSTTTDFRTITAGGTYSGRLKAGTLDLTNTPTDIAGQARDTVTPYIGCWEPLPLWLQASSLILKSRPWGKIKPPAGSTVNWGDPITCGLIVRLLLNENSGTKATDIARSNVCSITGPGWTAGTSGSALSFDGSNDYISFPTVNKTWGITTGFSFSIWFATTSATAQQMFTSDDVGGSVRNWQFRLQTTGAVGLIRFNSANTVLANYSTSATYKEGNWHHAVATFNDSVGSKIYVDGILRASDAVLTANSDRAGGGTSIGSRFNGGFEVFNGKLNNFSFYNRALTENEVQRLYTEQFAGITEPRIRIRHQYLYPSNQYGVFKPSILKYAK